MTFQEVREKLMNGGYEPQMPYPVAPGLGMGFALSNNGYTEIADPEQRRTMREEYRGEARKLSEVFISDIASASGLPVEVVQYLDREYHSGGFVEVLQQAEDLSELFPRPDIHAIARAVYEALNDQGSDLGNAAILIIEEALQERLPYGTMIPAEARDYSHHLGHCFGFRFAG
jgi:hypothetical protein